MLSKFTPLIITLPVPALLINKSVLDARDSTVVASPSPASLKLLATISSTSKLTAVLLTSNPSICTVPPVPGDIVRLLPTGELIVFVIISFSTIK